MRLSVLLLHVAACSALVRRLDGVSHFPWHSLNTLLAPNQDIYNTTDSIHASVDALATTCSSFLSHVDDVSRFGTNETRVVRLSSAAAATNKTTVLITFGIHGREYIASEVALALLHRLCDGSDRSAHVLDATEFIVIPVANVAGRKKVEAGDSSITCASLRKNENNVDLNRNFDWDWAAGDASKSAEDYRGRAPNSEPETQLIDALAARFRPSMYIDVHSGDTTMMCAALRGAPSCTAPRLFATRTPNNRAPPCPLLRRATGFFRPCPP